MAKPSLIALLLLCTLGCLEQEEGCIDALADNFEVSASKNCCCTYPDLVLSISHMHNKDNLTLGENYVNALGQTYSILDIEYFVSEFTIQLQDEVIPVENSIDLDLKDGSNITLPDDIIVVTRNQFQYKIGTLSQPGNYSNLQFSFGLSDPETSVETSTLPEDHILTPSENGLFDETEDTYHHLSLSLVTPAQDTLALRIESGIELPSVILETMVGKEKGNDLTYTCAIDYAVWFDQIDLSASQEEISSGIVAMMASSVLDTN